MGERGKGVERTGSSFQTILILVVIPLAAMAVFFLWQWANDGITPEETVQEVKATRSAILTTKPSIPADPALPRVTPRREQRSTVEPSRGAYRAAHTGSRKGDIVLIIDDLGFDGQPLERIMALEPNINLAILPNGTHAGEFARMLHARGFEVLCHLPMQPRGHEAPGRNAILASMSDEEIARTTRSNIEAIPFARGVNNHMGSLATADRRVMTSVIGALPQGMYFIDSRTGGSSVAATVAREMNVRTATRNVFLDDVATEHAVRKQLQELAAAAEKRGVAVGIGHPYPVTIRVLTDELPALKARGFRFVRASTVVN